MSYTKDILFWKESRDRRQQQVQKEQYNSYLFSTAWYQERVNEIQTKLRAVDDEIGRRSGANK